MTDLQSTDKKYKDLLNTLKIILPKVSYFGIDNVAKELWLSKNNKINKKSPFFYNSEKFTFIHYTSLASAENILRSKKLRLHSLASMEENDPNEFKSAIRYLNIGLTDENIYEIKNQIFTFSMCEIDVEDSGDSLYMWSRYAQEGTGIGLVFSVNKHHYGNWENYMLSRIYYDPENLKLIEEATNRYKLFLSKNHNVRIKELDKFFYRYYAFFKSYMYRVEKEVRILYTSGLDSFTPDKPQRSLTRNGHLANFVELDIEWEWDDDMKAYFKERNSRQINVIPMIKLEKVVFGYRLTEKQKESIAEVFHGLNTNYKNPPSFQDSTLSTQIYKY